MRGGLPCCTPRLYLIYTPRCPLNASTVARLTNAHLSSACTKACARRFARVLHVTLCYLQFRPALAMLLRLALACLVLYAWKFAKQFLPRL
jgi:hypothetical protein